MKTISLLGYTGWCGLGFIRGVKSYAYEKKKTTLDTYLYLNAVGYGCCGILLYANPFLMPLSIYKEIYRLEVTVRQLDKTDYYHQLF
jgi:hypothetical protein